MKERLRQALCEVFFPLRPMPVKRCGAFAVAVPRNNVAVGGLAVPKYSPVAGREVVADVVVLVLHRFPDVKQLIELFLPCQKWGIFRGCGHAADSPKLANLNQYEAVQQGRNLPVRIRCRCLRMGIQSSFLLRFS